MANVEIYQDGNVYRARLRTNDGRIDAIAGSQPTCREMAKYVEEWKRQVKASATIHVISSAPGPDKDETSTGHLDHIDADAPNYEADNEVEDEIEDEVEDDAMKSAEYLVSNSSKAELIAMADGLGLDTSGTKADIAQRICEAG
jgi:hypothetical protein